MALDFTTIPDHHGPAIYVLGDRPFESKLKPWCKSVNAATPEKTQVVYIDYKGSDGAKVANFYGIQHNNLPAILIVMDDDTLYKNWFGMDIPSEQTVIHEIGQITGRTAV